MIFKELLPAFIAGTPIKRKAWRGYWKYNPRIKNVEMYTKENTVILLTNTEDILFTLGGIVADDWEVAISGNCDVEVK
jgi:hypothetical protein